MTNSIPKDECWSSNFVRPLLSLPSLPSPLHAVPSLSFPFPLLPSPFLSLFATSYYLLISRRPPPPLSSLPFSFLLALSFSAFPTHSFVTLLFLFLSFPPSCYLFSSHLSSLPILPFAFRYQGNEATLCQYIDTTRKVIDCATTLPLRVFYIMKLCSRLFVLYCRNCPKYDKFRYFIPILRKLWSA